MHLDVNPMLCKKQFCLLTIMLLVLAFGLRIYRLSDSGIQNDEQIWHERAARFIQSALGPWAPEDLKIPKAYWPPRVHVDLSAGRSYPFTIKIPTLHPGTPASFFMGLSYLFLAKESSPVSLGIGSIIAAARYPGVVFGTLLVLVICLGGRLLVGDQAALWAGLIAAVEPMLVGYSRIALLDMSSALWISAAFFSFVHAQRTGRRRWAIVAGAFSGLALATNTYGAFLLPSFIATKVLLGKRHHYRGAEGMTPILLIVAGGIILLTALLITPGLAEGYLGDVPTYGDRAPVPFQAFRRVAAVAGGTAIVMGMLLLLFVRIRPAAKHWLQQLAIDRLDCALVLSWGMSYLFAYPNLWPNPIKGLYQVVQLNLSLPHIAGEITSQMPVSHWFYLLRSPSHVLPWVLGLALIGALFGLSVSSNRKSIFLLVLWGMATVVLLSIPPGRKFTKNFLQVMPVISLFAGLGVQSLLDWLAIRLVRLPRGALSIATAILILAGGILTTARWWPYPQTFTWPWLPDPQTLSIREMVGCGEGVKEAVALIRKQGPIGARVACFTGENNAAYYYDSTLLSGISQPSDLKDYDWLLVLPKLTFCVSDEQPLVYWVHTHEPDFIIRNHQIELVRLYELSRHLN